MKITSITIAALLSAGIASSYAQTGTTRSSSTPQPGVQPGSSRTTQPTPGSTTTQPTPGTTTPSSVTTPSSTYPQPSSATQPGTPGNTPAPSNPYSTQPGNNASSLNSPAGNDFQRPQNAPNANNPYQSPATQPSTGYTNPNTNTNNALSPVQTEQVPTGLRNTLQSSSYRGWENSTIYYDKGTNQYSMDLNTPQGVRTYRFDQNGNAIENTRSDGDQ